MKGTLTNTTVGRYGRFANGLWQIMGLIGIAKSQGFDYALTPWINWDHKERFGSTEEIDIYKHLVNPMPMIGEVSWPERHFGWGYHQVLLPEGNQNITGHFQSPKYFEHSMPEIRHHLKFKDEPQDNDFVALHYRAGDYTHGMDGYHPRQTFDYYEKAMKSFPVGSKFLVFSDDLIEAQNLLEPLADTFQITLFPGANYIEDFKKMKTCHSFIIANSSFSAAAAVLANQPGKKVVAPSRWFGKSWGENYKEMSKDIYDKTWTVI